MQDAGAGLAASVRAVIDRLKPQGSSRLQSVHCACTGCHCCVREFVCSKSVCEAVTRFLGRDAIDMELEDLRRKTRD